MTRRALFHSAAALIPLLLMMPSPLSAEETEGEDPDAAIARLNLAIDVPERNRGGAGMSIICRAGRQLRRWRDNAEVQDTCDRIMALMAA